MPTDCIITLPWPQLPSRSRCRGRSCLHDHAVLAAAACTFTLPWPQLPARSRCITVNLNKCLRDGKLNAGLFRSTYMNKCINVNRFFLQLQIMMQILYKISGCLSLFHYHIHKYIRKTKKLSSSFYFVFCARFDSTVNAIFGYIFI